MANAKAGHQPFVVFDNVCKYYQMGDTRIAASDHVSFTIEKGEFCVILGPSGAGKTTVLNMLGGMDTCDEGTILLDGEKVSSFSQKRLTTYRRYDVGFVFQFYNLVQNLTARENVDYKTGKQVLALLQDTCRQKGRTVIVITHNSALAAMADRVIRINSGRVIEETINANPTPVERIEW